MRTTLVKLWFTLFQFPMVLNSNSFKEVVHVLEKVRPGNGDGMFIFFYPRIGRLFLILQSDRNFTKDIEARSRKPGQRKRFTGIS